MARTFDITETKERLPGPSPANRSCRSCGAIPLSRNNPSDICAPCNGGEWEIPEPTEAEVIDLQRARFEELGAAA